MPVANSVLCAMRFFPYVTFVCLRMCRQARSPDSTALSLLQYNALGAKLAPLFKPSLLDDLPADRKGSRDFIYDLYEEYEREKAQLVGYDLSDVVHYIYQQLDQHRHHARTPVHSIFVDETQDFTQAELALFLRVAEDKNDLFFRFSRGV